MASSSDPSVDHPGGIGPSRENPTGSLFPLIIVTGALCMAATTSLTIMRLYAKRALGRFVFEDYLSIFVWMQFVAYISLVIAQGKLGLGRHIFDITAEDATRIAHVTWLDESMYLWLIWTSKLCLLVQLMRIFTPIKIGVIYYTIHALIWGNLAFTIAAFGIVLHECLPIRKIWDPSIKGDGCVDKNLVLFATSVVNCVSDLLIYALPMWAIYRLQMALVRKLHIGALFATGFFGLIGSFCRLGFTTRMFHSIDSTYIIAQLAMWSLAEIASIILCTCFPMMPAFVKAVRTRNDRIKTRHSRGSRRSTHAIQETHFHNVRNNINTRRNGDHGEGLDMNDDKVPLTNIKPAYRGVIEIRRTVEIETACR